MKAGTPLLVIEFHHGEEEVVFRFGIILSVFNGEDVLIELCPPPTCRLVVPLEKAETYVMNLLALEAAGNADEELRREAVGLQDLPDEAEDPGGHEEWELEISGVFE